MSLLSEPCRGKHPRHGMIRLRRQRRHQTGGIVLIMTLTSMALPYIRRLRNQTLHDTYFLLTRYSPAASHAGLIVTPQPGPSGICTMPSRTDSGGVNRSSVHGVRSMEYSR